MAPLYHDSKAHDVEIIRHIAQDTRRHQFKTRLGSIIGIAPKLPLFHLFQQTIDLGVFGINLDTDLGQSGQNVGAARLIGDQDLTSVADQCWIYMLVGLGIF